MSYKPLAALADLAYKCGPRLHHCATAKEYCLFPYRRAPLSTRAARQLNEMNVHKLLVPALLPRSPSLRTTPAGGYVMDDSNIRTAVDAWFDDRSGAEATYGHISTWETGGVTDMSWLFCARDWPGCAG